MFKVGDKVRSVSDRCTDITVGNVYTVTYASAGMIDFLDDDGHRRRRDADDYELVQDEPCACTCDLCASQDADDSIDYGEEKYVLSYTRSYENGDADGAYATISGDSAGDIEMVLQAMLRDFLVRSGFAWVHELNVTAEDGTWHSSAPTV